MIPCCQNAFKKLKGHSHHVWKFMNFESFCTSGFPGSKKRAEPRRLTGGKLADGSVRETEVFVAADRDWVFAAAERDRCFAAAESDGVFLRRCWVKQSSCCCRRRPGFSRCELLGAETVATVTRERIISCSRVWLTVQIHGGIACKKGFLHELQLSAPTN